ncbi:MAG: hypothetical protein JRI74_08755 [Deltaproteobacteria bacterium]|nr:hypothetical protein [Deltaproteobacteria bacterium]
MKETDIQSYISIGARQKWWLIIPFLLCLLGGFAYLMIVPRLYEATATIFVQDQKVPEDVVRPMIDSIENRVTLVTQQVLSRISLNRMIRKFDLYGSNKKILAEDKIELFREKIKIEPTYQTIQSKRSNLKYQEISSFAISFRYEDPTAAKEVANELAASVISENLKMREAHVMGTSTFLFDELASVEKELAEKEEILKQYREKYMGELPGQLDTNLKFLERLHGQLDQRNRDLRTAENRKIIIKEQIAGSTIINVDGKIIPADVSSLRIELASLELKYSDNHPDIIRLRKMIAKVDAEISRVETDLEDGKDLPWINETLRLQFQQVTLEIKDIKTEIRQILSEVKQYKTKIAQSPKREQELAFLKRDYDNMRGLYDTLYSRKVNAEIAVSMERKQKGEQFRIIEPAITPTIPVEPRIGIVFVLAVALGLGLGSGLAVLKETMDTSYKTPEEIKEDLRLPILVELPFQYTETKLKEIKRKNAFAYATVGLCFILSAIGIALAAN